MMLTTDCALYGLLTKHALKAPLIIRPNAPIAVSGKAKAVFKCCHGLGGSSKHAVAMLMTWQVESDMGLPKFESSAAALDHAKRVMKLFGQTRHLYSSLDEKERGPADELPIVASTALIRAWKHYDGSEPALLLQVRDPAVH